MNWPDFEINLFDRTYDEILPWFGAIQLDQENGYNKIDTSSAVLDLQFVGDVANDLREKGLFFPKYWMNHPANAIVSQLIDISPNAKCCLLRTNLSLANDSAEGTMISFFSGSSITRFRHGKLAGTDTTAMLEMDVKCGKKTIRHLCARLTEDLSRRTLDDHKPLMPWENPEYYKRRRIFDRISVEVMSEYIESGFGVKLEDILAGRFHRGVESSKYTNDFQFTYREKAAEVRARDREFWDYLNTN